MSFSSSVIMADLTTPASSSRAAARSCRLGGPGYSRFGFPVIRRRVHDWVSPLPEGLLMALVGRCVLLAEAAESQSCILGRATDQGAVSQLICLRTAR